MRRLRLARGQLRSAGIIAAATLALGATTTLAANQPQVHPSATPHPSSSPSASASASPSVKPSTRPSGKASSEPSTAPSSAPSSPARAATPPAGGGDAHGDCVARVANDQGAEAPNKNGKMSHGAAVSKAAHTCPKGGDDGDSANGAHDSEGADSPEKPDTAESPDPADTPDPAESPESGD